MDAFDSIIATNAVTCDKGFDGHDVHLATDKIDSDVVDIMDMIVDHEEAINISVKDESFAVGGLAIVNVAAIDGDVSDGSICVGAQYGDGTRTFPLQVVDVAITNFDIGANAVDVDAGTLLWVGGIANFQIDHAKVALVSNFNHIVFPENTFSCENGT